MLAAESLCPYCGKERQGTKGPKCLICNMELGDRYLMYIDPKNNVSNLCSTRCLELLEESIKSYDNEKVVDEEGYDLRENVCPMCGLKITTSTIEAKSVCKLCGMLIDRESPKYVIRGKSVYLHFCCSKCVKVYSATRGLDFNKIHAEEKMKL
jgi:hypothetical protein